MVYGSAIRSEAPANRRGRKMRAVLEGKLVEVEEQSWTGQDGQVRTSTNLYVKQGDSERYAADRIAATDEVLAQVEEGESYAFTVAIRARISRNGTAYLNVYATEVEPLRVPESV